MTAYTARVCDGSSMRRFASIADSMAPSDSRCGGIGPIRPYRFLSGTRYVGMPPDSTSPCSIDLWQLRSQSTTSPSPTAAVTITRFDVDVPLVTEYVRCAPNTRAAYFSCSPIGPLWSSNDPSAPTLLDRSDRSRFSPKKSKNARPTGDLRNAVPPVCPGVCQEYS